MLYVQAVTPIVERITLSLYSNSRYGNAEYTFGSAVATLIILIGYAAFPLSLSIYLTARHRVTMRYVTYSCVFAISLFISFFLNELWVAILMLVLDLIAIAALVPGIIISVKAEHGRINFTLTPDTVCSFCKQNIPTTPAIYTFEGSSKDKVSVCIECAQRFNDKLTFM